MLEELININVRFILRQGMSRKKNLSKSIMLLTHITAFLYNTPAVYKQKAILSRRLAVNLLRIKGFIT